MLRYAMLHYAMLCYATLRFAALCYAMLRYAMPCFQSALRQQLELERDAAVHKQQLEVDRHVHALQLAQQAHTAAQTESDRLRQKHVQEVELCEVWSQLPLLCCHYFATTTLLPLCR